MSDVGMTIEAVWKNESTRLVAAIARVTRDVGIAEDLPMTRWSRRSSDGRKKVSPAIPQRG